MNGFIKMFDVSKHEPKLLTKPKSGYDMFSNFGEIILAKCNSNGTILAVTIATEQLIPDGLIYIWNIEKDFVSSFDFLGKYGSQSQPVGILARYLQIKFVNFSFNLLDALRGYLKRLLKKYFRKSLLILIIIFNSDFRRIFIGIQMTVACLLARHVSFMPNLCHHPTSRTIKHHSSPLQFRNQPNL